MYTLRVCSSGTWEVTKPCFTRVGAPLTAPPAEPAVGSCLTPSQCTLSHEQGGCQVRGHRQTLSGAEVVEVRRGEEAGARGPPRGAPVGAAAGAGAVLGWGLAGRGRGAALGVLG